MIKLITKAEAVKRGFKYYLTGKECKRGHKDFRSVLSNNCRICLRIRSYERSLLPHVKAANKAAKQTEKYKKQQKEYLKKKNPNAKVLKPQGFKVDLTPGTIEYKREYARLYYHHNKRKIKELNQNRDPEVRKKYIREWQRNYIKTPEGSAINFMRKCVHRCLKNKEDLTEKILGYKKEDLVRHLERQFIDGMTWENRNEWHIDHIVPISHFLENNETDPMVINALDNLQPLWAEDNLKKGAKIV